MKSKKIKQSRSRVPLKIAKTVLGITAKILVELIEQQEDLNFLYFHRYRHSGSIREIRYAYERNEAQKEVRRRRQAVARLRRNKLITLRKEGDRIVVALTRDGRVKALQASIMSSEAYLSEGYLCLVTFDFPEAARKARFRFRWLLKRAGFEFVQRSVWSTRKDVREELKEIIECLHIARWVNTYIVEK